MQKFLIKSKRFEIAYENIDIKILLFGSEQLTYIENQHIFIAVQEFLIKSKWFEIAYENIDNNLNKVQVILFFHNYLLMTFSLC